jgi:magnesium transporter
MISILKGKEGLGIAEIEHYTEGCWVNVIDPTPEEISALVKLGIPQDFITSPLDLDERPRSEKDDEGSQLILIKVPYFQGDELDVPYTSIPLGIILTEKYIITVCKKNNIILDELLRTKLKGFSTGKKIRFVLRVLLLSATKFLSYLREINNSVERLEDSLTASMRNKEVLELLKYQKSLVYFETALKSNELMMERLQKTPIFRRFPEDEDLLEDVLTENQQAIEMVAIAENILSSMMDAFASIISNNLNVVMKFLASVTIVLSIPTIITSFFGMNVPLPMSSQPWSYLGVIAIFASFCLLVILIFIRKDWF